MDKNIFKKVNFNNIKYVFNNYKYDKNYIRVSLVDFNI